MEGVQNKIGLMMSSDAPSRKKLHRAMVPANAYQRTKFQFPSSISFGDMEWVPKSKSGLLISPDAP